MKQLSSRDNPLIKKLLSLKEKKYRDKYSLFLAEGPNLVTDMLKSGILPLSVFVTSEHDEEICGIIASLNPGIQTYELTHSLFDEISSENSPQGICALVSKPVYSPDEFNKAVFNKNILVFDRIQDPGNAGTLIRSSEAMGFGGIVVIKGSTDIYSSKSVKASAGSIFRMPVMFTDNAAECICYLKNTGRNIYSACMDGKLSVFDADIAYNIALVIGNEGNGVSKEFISNTEQLFIPMDGSPESLNAALAGTIIMYESKRQRS